MSSHREAPAISKDPVADSTDVYAFRSPDASATVTILANYIPLQDPAGGPNFNEFGDDVQYDVNIVNDASGTPAITYRFHFTTTIVDTDMSHPGAAGNPHATFLYATGPIKSLTDPNWNRQQTYTLTKIVHKGTGAGTMTMLSPNGGGKLSCPPCNIGPRSTPNYSNLSALATYTLTSGEKVYAGQRAEGFYVDLGSIFDLGDLRPLSPDQLIPGSGSLGINSTSDKNVHTLALQIPISELTSNNDPAPAATDEHAVIGVYTTASRQAMRMFNASGPTTITNAGAFVQVSRLGSPLVNEVVVPIQLKDFFNSQPPVKDAPNGFGPYVANPIVANLLPVLYPGAFPNLAAFIKSGQARTDIEAIFLTGIPGSVIGAAFGVGTSPGSKSVPAEMLRLNVGIAPTSKDGTDPGKSNLGLLGKDLAGFPNGRRPLDDVATIELKALAGATLPLTYPKYTPDKAVSSVTQGVSYNPQAYQAHFPYLADPHPGFSNPPGSPASDNGSRGTNFTPTNTVVANP